MDDTRNPKPDLSPIFISPADLPLDSPLPLFMTKRKSVEEFDMKCRDTLPSIHALMEKSAPSSKE